MFNYEDKLERLDKKYKKKMLKAKYKSKKREYISNLMELKCKNSKNVFVRMYDKLGFTKVLVIYVEINALIVQIWSMYEMHINNDLSALPYLIAATVTEAIGLIIFFVKKSTAENTKGGIIYDLAMKDKGEELKTVDPFKCEEELDVGKDGDI